MGTSKGNKPYYTPEQLRNKFQEFCIYAQENNKAITKLQFTSRLMISCSYLNDIEGSISYDYSNVLKKIDWVCQAFLENRLVMEKSWQVGVIFALKNHYWWQDKRELVYSNDNKEALKTMSYEELKALSDAEDPKGIEHQQEEGNDA